MKKAIIVTLVGVNLALLAVLMFGASPQRADAQAFRGGADYLMINAHISSDLEAVYVLDMAQRRLAAWRFDKSSKRMMPFRGRMLERDFQQTPAAPQGRR